MKDMPAIVGGKNMDFTYNDCKKEMEMVNKAFIETMIEGDANGRGFKATPTAAASSTRFLPIPLPKSLTGAPRKTTVSCLK